MDFTAIDFETANASRASICSVGLVRVENGSVVKEIRQLINPCCAFNFYNTCVHGITAFDVRDAPTFDSFFGKMQPYLEDTVVAHNAAFDISCLRASLERYDIAFPDFDYLCTLSISRRTTKGLKSHRLDSLADYYGLGEFNHHDALADAKICARIFEILSSRVDVAPLKKPFREKTVRRCRETDAFEAARRILKSAETKERMRAKHTPQSELVFDYSRIDFTKTFVVTGDFGDMTGQYIESLISYRGGTVSRTVNGSTDYVVVGDKPLASWGSGEYGREIDAALSIGKARFVKQSHLINQII